MSLPQLGRQLRGTCFSGPRLEPGPIPGPQTVASRQLHTQTCSSDGVAPTDAHVLSTRARCQHEVGPQCGNVLRAGGTGPGRFESMLQQLGQSPYAAYSVSTRVILLYILPVIGVLLEGYTSTNCPACTPAYGKAALQSLSREIRNVHMRVSNEPARHHGCSE